MSVAAETLSVDISNLHRGVIYQIQVAEKRKQSFRRYTYFTVPIQVRTSKEFMSHCLGTEKLHAELAIRPKYAEGPLEITNLHNHNVETATVLHTQRAHSNQ